MRAPRPSASRVWRQVLALAAILAVPVLTPGCNESRFKGSAERLNPTLTREFTQDAYPSREMTVEQGHSGDPRSESFEQGEWGALDIVVVIDNSPSMAEEQINLGSKLDPLLSRVAKADWRIAVATTDPVDGCQRALISKSDLNATEKFREAINAGIKGSGVERGIGQAVSALKCNGGAWVRPESTVVVLIVTDEDNCYIDTSRGYGCTLAPDRNGSHLTDYLSSIRTLGKDAKVYGLLWHPATPADQCSTGHKQGDIYADVIAAAGGTWGSICSADYTQTLQEISGNIAEILKYEFELAHLPDPGTLKILVDGAPWDKVAIDGRKVRFTEPPPFGSKVEVKYRHGATGDLAAAFKLEKAPVADSIAVEIDGVAVQGAGFKWDPRVEQVVFTEVPAERAKIRFVYKEKTQLKTRFAIGKDVEPSSIVVRINDSRVRDGWKYEAASGEIVFAEAPAESARIKVTFTGA